MKPGGARVSAPKPARIARLAAGKTIEEASKAARLSVSSIRKIEHGAPASYRVACALARFYGVTDWSFRRHRPRKRRLVRALPGQPESGAEREAAA